MDVICKKKRASAAPSYVMMFTLVLIFMVVVLYLASVARLMTHQHHIDDSLADSVLASLVADDTHYFETDELEDPPTVRFANVNNSFSLYKECMDAAISETPGFYYNFKYDEFICYEVDHNTVIITTFTGSGGAKSVTAGRLGVVKTPKGNIVRETSAYARVRFDINNIIDGSFITKTKDIYCTLEINETEDVR